MMLMMRVTMMPMNGYPQTQSSIQSSCINVRLLDTRELLKVQY